MTNCRYDRGTALEDCPCNLLFIECPEIFDGTASASYNDRIHTCPIKHTDTLHNAVGCPVALYQCRIQNDLKIWVPAQRNISDILYCRTRRCGHNAKLLYKTWDRLLIFRSKHPHFFQFCFQSKEFLIKCTCPFQRNLSGVHLVASVSLVDIHRTADYNAVTILHSKCKTSSLPCKHHTGKQTCLILQ